MGVTESPRTLLTQGELDVMRRCFEHRDWRRLDIPVTTGGLAAIDKKLYELGTKTRWPGTKSFDHEAAYMQEILQRVRIKVAAALELA